MPLPFDSLSHGRIAFGFFNIDSDMLLLERYFFFAGDFCRHISRIAKTEPQEELPSLSPAYFIESPEDVGDLMGAIHGVRHMGFIGEIYRRFPFPQKEEDFRQKPEGSETREIVASIISEYSQIMEIPFSASDQDREAAIGECRFGRDSFQELLKYVWRGGYPRWKDEQRPPYVLDMKLEAENSRRRLFDGISFEERASDVFQL